MTEEKKEYKGFNDAISEKALVVLCVLVSKEKEKVERSLKQLNRELLVAGPEINVDELKQMILNGEMYMIDLKCTELELFNFINEREKN